MASYRIAVIKNDMKSDKTWNVKIRVTHKRRIGYIGTHKYGSRTAMDKNFKIINEALIYSVTPKQIKYKN